MDPETPIEPTFSLETEQRLSQSMLWRLQRRYFNRAGIDAWRTTTVPHYVTNNPALAHAYAEVFLGFLRDCRSGSSALDPDEPITLVELGAGSGRFAYLFLKALTEMHQRSAIRDVRFRYVMTDFTATNVRYWREHPRLRPFVERGVLDFGVFDIEEGREIKLLEAGVTIGAGSLSSPLGVIANYVFDGVSQDAFSFEGGALRECLVTLDASEPATDLDNPELLEKLSMSYTHRPTHLDYYGDAELDDVLKGYVGSLDSVTVLFPCAAIRCIRRLAELAGGRLLLLSGDRGDIREDAVGHAGAPGLSLHGSFSLDVNYHAVARWVLGRGGLVLATAHRHAHLSVSAFLLGAHPREHEETRLAYEQAIEVAGPDDFFSLRQGIQGGYDQLGIDQLLSLIRLSRWDPRILRDCLPALSSHLALDPETRSREVVQTVLRVWDNYYSIDEELDLAFELGLLLHGVGAHREALALFDESTRLRGDNPRTQWNMGLCHWGMGSFPDALQCFARAAQIDEGWRPVGALQVKA